MPYALVSRDALETLLMHDYELRQDIAVQNEYEQLQGDDVLVTLAVEAGLPIPGPLRPGTVPPAPPAVSYELLDIRLGQALAVLEQRANAEGLGKLAAQTYRAQGDNRLRCVDDTKVVYTSMESAEAAAKLISQREPMKAYLGRCGHYHVSRRKRNGQR